MAFADATAGTLSPAAVARQTSLLPRVYAWMTAGLAATFPAGETNEKSVFLRRYAATAGVAGRLVQTPFFVDALAEAVLGWLVVAGKAQDGRGTYGAFDPGVSVGVRAGRRILPQLELSLGVAGWRCGESGGGGRGRRSPGAPPRWGSSPVGGRSALGR